MRVNAELFSKCWFNAGEFGALNRRRKQECYVDLLMCQIHAARALTHQQAAWMSSILQIFTLKRKLGFTAFCFVSEFSSRFFLNVPLKPRLHMLTYS